MLRVLMSFESNFELKAVVHMCGMIEIVGVNKDGREVFKYYLGGNNERNSRTSLSKTPKQSVVSDSVNDENENNSDDSSDISEPSLESDSPTSETE